AHRRKESIMRTISPIELHESAHCGYAYRHGVTVTKTKITSYAFGDTLFQPPSFTALEEEYFFNYPAAIAQIAAYFGAAVAPGNMSPEDHAVLRQYAGLWDQFAEEGHSSTVLIPRCQIHALRWTMQHGQGIRCFAGALERYRMLEHGLLEEA